ncbi:hypothetical protein NHQ30_004429 [Ciborinia camelliae]|nr:hypothetical protein NHQ30_004429 [Ciborinia camelliae]
MASTAVKEKDTVPHYSDNLGSDLVRILVGGDGDSAGTEKVEFVLHKKILCAKVPFFEKMFNGSFLEGTTQVATLPEDDPDAFRLLVAWVYTGSIASEVFPGNTFLLPLSALFILAEKYCIAALMDFSIESIRDQMDKKQCLAHRHPVESIYEKTHAKSKLRVLLSVIVANVLVANLHRSRERADDKDAWSNEDLQSLLCGSADLTLDVIKIMREAEPFDRRFATPIYFPRCHYHQHGKDEKCPYGL